MKRGLWIAATLLSVLLIGLAFRYPHQLIAPGNLIPVHAALNTDCFACHAPFRGASPDRCIACHAIADIGRKTTKGAPVASRRPPFHQALVSRNCMACHSDHPRPRLVPAARVTFAHEQIRPDLLRTCATCHVPPRDTWHQGRNLPCAQCHRTRGWQPVSFDHDRYFRLDRDHRTACITCHTGGDYQRYGCYGCHEHQPAQIRARHLEEGISNIGNCVRCHRSPDAEPTESQDGERDD